jgi:large subunit ribosomal protein L25
MERVKLVAHPRTESGSRAVRRLRKQGMIPGVLYGHGKPAHMLSVGDRDLREAIHKGGGMNAVLDIVLEGQKTTHTAVIKDYQLDGVRHVVTHVDFHEVKLSEPIEATVAIVVEGEPAGVKIGGSLDVLLREITVKALPMEIPEKVVLDVSALEMGDVARVVDLVLPDEVEVLDVLDEVVCTVLVPRKAVLTPEEEAAEGEEAAAEEAAGEAEPEVISHGKSDDEEA